MPHPLLDGLFDYAGLFPPARLPLAGAVARFAAHRAGPEAPLVGRFVLPAREAGALAAALPSSDAPVRLALIGTGGADTDAFFHGVEADLDGVCAALQDAPHLLPDVYEVRLPDAVVAEPGAVGALVERVHVALATSGLAGLALAFEVPVHGVTAPESLAALADVLATQEGMLKLRTGGPAAADVPAPEALAAALVADRDARVRFKCTAGLHHPVYAPAGGPDGAPMHGFLNVFGGATLLHAGAVPPEVLPDVLREAYAGAFALGADGSFTWRETTIPADAVRAARGWATGFGTCSIDEPVDDLRALGLLDAALADPAAPDAA